MEYKKTKYKYILHCYLNCIRLFIKRKYIEIKLRKKERNTLHIYIDIFILIF